MEIEYNVDIQYQASLKGTERVLRGLEPKGTQTVETLLSIKICVEGISSDDYLFCDPGVNIYLPQQLSQKLVWLQ